MNYTAEEQKEHRKLWVKALRSGKYEQTQGRLRTETGFCCLGVACDISNISSWRKFESSPLNHTYLGNDGVLPIEVREWLGINFKGAFYDQNKMKFASLANMNDMGSSFEEIADIIESDPEWFDVPL